ncbi:MAG: glycosyltransferase family 4 protein [Psychroflexus halocasei]
MKTTIFDGSFKTTAFIRRLIQGLVNNGVEVSVIGFNEENPQLIPGVNYQSLGSNQSKLRFIKTSLALAIQSGSLSKVLTAFQLILKGKRKKLQEQNLDIALKQIKPDVVHVQWPSLLPWFENYQNKRDFKLVLSQRGSQNNIKAFVNQNSKEVIQKFYPCLDGIHSVSKNISNKYQIFTPTLQVPNHVIYSGMSIPDINLDELQLKQDHVLKLISVGRSHWVKDYPTAIQACKILKEKQVDFHYTIIGALGDEETLFLVHELGLSDHVTLTGKMPQDQVFKEVQNADFMLLPSIEEGIANVAVEAMALGTPVISTDCGGMQELITHNKEGWIVPTRDLEALAKEVMRFQTLEKEQIKQIIQAARAKVEQQHTEEMMVEGMMNLYNSVHCL